MRTAWVHRHAALAFAAAVAATACHTFEYPDAESSAAAPAAAETGGPAGAPAPAKARDPIADARREIEAARSLPLPAGNYAVEVRRVWALDVDASALEALFRFTDEHLDVQVGTPSSTSGFRIGVAKDGFSAAVAGTISSLRSAVQETAMIVTVAGYPASLQVGETRFLVPFTVGGQPFGLVVPEGQFVGTSLEVTLTAAGPGQVVAALVPVFSNLGDRGETVHVTQAVTTIGAPLGQPILISSSDRRSSTVATALLSRRSENRDEQGVLILTIRGG